ncbi:MAG: hypothetical protein U5L76_02435 [Patescibacteria group bacterium]|nr:hypothetical protein [Patescibacteria group bacterium]
MAGGKAAAHIAATSGSLATLRHRSREVLRNNAYANSAIESFVANADFGTGIVPRLAIKRCTDQRENTKPFGRDGLMNVIDLLD